MTRLSPRQEEIVVLVVLWGLTYDEVAARLGCSVHTVRNHAEAIGRALRKPPQRAMAEYCRTVIVEYDKAG